MASLTPHLWYHSQAREATALYTSLFPNSAVSHIQTIKDTPSGDCDIVAFSLLGQSFMAISAGPIFDLNPSISLFVTFDSEEEIQKVWDALIDGGKALMPFDTYPWAQKYGWLQDKYGLSWQLSLSSEVKELRITPHLMFTGAVAGKAREAIESYTHLFPNSQIETVVPYEKGDGDQEGFIKYSNFTLNGRRFGAMDSSFDHKFGFNEAVSFIVSCDTQEEIDFYWEKLSAVPESEQCGWLKDIYGVSWQITPSVMDEMMSKGTPEQIDRVTQAFLQMKKFDIAALTKAFEG
jgi:predicted 3-demethylubiquinone-9 3-methyltransferase (glyoxalase superfamily)